MAAWSWPKEHARHGTFPRTCSSWVNTSFIVPELCICQQTPQLSRIVTEDPRALLGFSKCVMFLFSSHLHAPAPPQLTPLTWLHHPTHRNVRGRVISASRAHGGPPAAHPRILPHDERRRHARLILARMRSSPSPASASSPTPTPRITLGGHSFKRCRFNQIHRLALR